MQLCLLHIPPQVGINIYLSEGESNIMRAKGTEEPIAEIHHRAYAGDPDFWRIRTFLIDTYSIAPLGLI
jgi:hypothetical protein